MSNRTGNVVYRALYIHEKFGAFQVGPKKLPTPAPGEVLVKEFPVALNPIDWMTQKVAMTEREYPAILGWEGTGEVEAVGEGVTNFKKGDKVFHQGFWQNDYATFQEYVLCPAVFIFQASLLRHLDRHLTTPELPPNITLDQAAFIPTGVGIAAVPLYSQAPSGFGFKAPWDGGRTLFSGQAILIFGGATSAGQYAIQFARLRILGHHNYFLASQY